MGIKETLEYIYGLRGGRQPAQERFRALLGVLGDPQRAFESVHVAGTNGKGSTCAFLASVLTHSGKKTGLFTSPYLERFNERMQMDGVPIPDGALISAVDAVRAAAGRIAGEHGPLRPFEAITAAAFLWFAQSGAEVAVVEAGLGGGSDATNVLRPTHAAIASVSLDHTARLGGDVASIAREKAGILKPGVFAVIHPQERAAEAAIRERASACGCRALFLRPEDVRVREDSLARRVFDLDAEGAKLEGIEIALLGRHQMDNAAGAACIALDMGLRPDVIREGLKSARWPGRLEMVKTGDGRVLLDGAHNAGGARALRGALERYFGDIPKVLVCAVSRDKDIASMARIWAPAFSGGVVATALGRTMEAGDVARHFASAGARTLVRDTPEAALQAARAAGHMVVGAGSIYLVGALRAFLNGQMA